MKLTTSRFGDIQVDESKIIAFTEDMPGFKECRRFVLIDHNPGSPFKWLQCTDNGSLAFVVIDPVMVVVDYKPEISDSELIELEIDSIEKAVLLCIVNINRDSNRVTINMLGPLVINPEKKCGKQAIALNSDYSIKHDITSACHPPQKEQAYSNG